MEIAKGSSLSRGTNLFIRPYWLTAATNFTTFHPLHCESSSNFG
jgi:hypothetical protein